MGRPSEYASRASDDCLPFRAGHIRLRRSASRQRADHPIRPRQGGQQFPLEVKEGQTPLAAALSFLDEEPDRFRGLLVDAEQPDVAAQVQNVELRNAAQQIRSIRAAAGHMPAA
jgi:hypothetical protein